MDFLYPVILYPIIYILPAYVANGAPVLFGGGRTIDNGKRLWGNPIFGQHKTWRGLVAGILSGTLMAAAEGYFMPALMLAGIAMSFGAHFGDLLGSFIKRRMRRDSGNNMFLLDQYLFVIFALIFAAPFGEMPTLYGIVFLLILTGVLHISTNAAAHKMKLKDVPW